MKRLALEAEFVGNVGKANGLAFTDAVVVRHASSIGQQLGKLKPELKEFSGKAP